MLSEIRSHREVAEEFTIIYTKHILVTNRFAGKLKAKFKEIGYVSYKVRNESWRRFIVDHEISGSMLILFSFSVIKSVPRKCYETGM